MFNIEEAIISFLASEGFDAYADVPEVRPDEFITVERTGGSTKGVSLDNPTVAIQCWSTSRFKSSMLALRVSSVMDKITEHSQAITKIKQTSLYNFPVDGQARYQIIYDITNYK